jgi:quinol monooxygenase YgiN
MSISLIVSGIGAVVAAIGTGVMLARCFRTPRGDIIAWSVALLGLLVSLGAQTIGHLAGFDSAMFRAMELGGQVIAPLALILALSEVAAKSTPARFCARLYIPALAIVAVVVLALDQLADVPFSKAWPNPAVYYETPPDYVLYAVGVVTALIALVTVGFVLRRSLGGARRAGWQAVLPAQLMGGAAALALAYPELAELVAYKAGVHLPVRSEFSVLCTAAAGLAWLAGARTGQLRLAVLHGGDADDSRGLAANFDDADQTGDFEPFGLADEQGVYRGGGLYRPDRPDQNATRSYSRDQDDSGLGWQDDRAGGGGDDWRRHDDIADGGGYRDQGRYRSDYETGDFDPGDFADGDLATGDHDLGYPAGGWQSSDRAGDGFSGSPSRTRAEPERAQLLGQIAIYTLLEDRVDEFDRLTERVVEQVRSREPDTLVFIVHAVPSAPMQRILYEVYKSRAAYQWHTQQPHVAQFEADRRPYVLATNVIELGLQQGKVSSVPFPSVDELFGEPAYDTSGFARPDYLRDHDSASARPDRRREHR